MPKPDNKPPATIAVGDVVDYWPAQGRPDDFSYFDASQPCMATVVYVHPHGPLNLRVADQHGKTYAETEVEMVTHKIGDELPRDKHFVSPRAVPTPTQLEAQISELQSELEEKAEQMHPHPEARRAPRDHARSAAKGKKK